MTTSRREFLSAGAASLTMTSIAASATAAPPPVKALVFDVFGTVVDWRTSIIREGQLLTKAKGFAVDWGAFADAWRGGYQPAMDRVRAGELPWTTIDELHRMVLDELLKRFEIRGLSGEEIEHLNRAWHRLIPWPDTVSGLNRLRTRYLLATLSNGNVALLANMAKNAALPWDSILSAEQVRRYKPDPEVYLSAARMLGLSPSEVMMVAAHPGDLRASRKAGLRTAFVYRPLEYGPDKPGDTIPESEVDVSASDFLDLATKLGV
jgi:2-haloacid dehalogenase